MSKRTDKKKQKRFNEVHPTTTAPAAQPVVETAAPTAEPVPEVTVTETTAPVKPEDKKAYYACAGGTGAIELA